MIMLTQTRSEFLTESLVETLNNSWYVDAIESESTFWRKLFIFPGRKYISIKACDVTGKNGEYNSHSGGTIWMFVDRKTGECYKPANLKAPAKGVRFQIDQLSEYPEICDRFGSFLYIR
jgi:hypothetical protein